ncbi:HNH endonuclease [Rhodococcus erythropolis]|uniref:HNH endonuclease n=1 Tax=Rhodococcus erythropolis TaxID=1833 RepID=UPI003AF40080
MKVSKEDAGEISRIVWYPSSGDTQPQLCYAKSVRKGGSILAHRHVVERMLGKKLTSSEFVDHRNRDPLDNRRINLRVCTLSQNGANKTISSRNTSGFKGVSYCSQTKQWRATITLEGNVIRIGRFQRPEVAGWYYDQYAVQLFGDFAVLNFEYR